MPFADDEVAAPIKTDEDSFGGGVATADAPPILEKPTWGDVGQAAKAGIHEGAAALAGTMSAISPYTSPGTDAATRFQEMGARERGEQQQDIEGMTPAGKSAREGSFWSHPLVVGAEGAPALAAQAGPAIIGGALAGPGGALAGAALGAGAYGAGQAVSDFTQQVMDAPEETLMQQPDYAAKIQQGVAPQAARLEFAQEHSGKLAAESGAIGAATALPFAELGGAGTAGKVIGDSLIMRVLGGGLEAGAVGGVQGGAQTAASGKAGADVGIRGPVTAGEIAHGVGEGATSMAPLGVAGGLLHGKTRLPEGGKSAEPTRSQRDYSKPEAQVTAPVDINTPPGNKAPPPPPPKVDVDQAAALNPVTPGVSNAQGEAARKADIYRNRGGTDQGQVSQRPNLEPEKTQANAAPQPSETQVQEVTQPEVVQPQPVINREGQGQGDTTQLSPLPPEEAAPQPPLAPASPVEDAGALTPEPSASLQEQHAALVDPANPREAMLYPKGEQVFDIPKETHGQVRLSDGRIVQYDKSGPSGLTAAKVRQYAKDDRLNEALQLGPVSKDEAISRVAAGEPGAVVTERTPDGTSVKDAVGTAATAPAQADALEAAKTPGNTVQVEDPAAALADRQARVAQEQPVQPPVVPTGRVLEAQDEANLRARDAAALQDAQQAHTVAEQLRQKEAIKQAAAAEAAGAKAEAKRSHAAKAAQESVSQANHAAAKIVADHPHTGSYADANAIVARAKAMARAAAVEGIDIPKAFPEGHHWNAAMVKLREAKDLLSPIKKELGETREEKLGRFIDREHMIDNGRVQEALAARRAEGARGLGSPEGAVDRVGPRADADEAAEQTGEHIAPSEAREGDVIASTETRHEEGATELPTEYISGEHEEAPVSAPAEPAKPLREVREGRDEDADYRPAKAAVGFQVAKIKSRAIKRQELEDEPKHLMATNSEGNPTEVTPQRSTTVKDALDEHFDPKKYAPEMRPMMERLRDAIMRVAGDTAVHYISHEDMLKLGERARGLYDPNEDHILLNADKITHDTALHEAFHGATSKALNADPELKALMGRLQSEMGIKDDPEEFLTRLMTDDKLQDQFKTAKISPELARDIGIPKWRKATMWEGALNLFRRALGLGPRDVSAVEAAMALSEKAMWKRDPGMAMEAGARSLGLRFQKMDPPERDQEAFLKSPMEHLENIKNIDREMVKGYAKDLSANLKVGLTKTAKWMSGTQLRDLHGKLFEDGKGNILDAINHARNKAVTTFNKLRTGDKDLVQRGYMLDRKYASEMPNYAELLNLSSRYNIHADREAPKVPKNPEDAARKNWQTNAHGDEAREIYKNLPAELQKRYRDEKQYYRDKQQELAKTVMDKVLPVLDLPADMEERVRNNDLTDADWKVLEDKHAADAIKSAQRLINKKDVYFPGGRGDGRFVVTGKYEMPKGGSDTDYSGGKLADNKREFDTEKEAHDYVTKTHLPATVRETNYWTDPSTGKVERTTAGEAASSGTMTKKYEVSLERQHTEMHDSYSDAVKARAEMDKAGVGELSGVLDKRNDRMWATLGTGEQRALERRITNRDNLTSAEKQHLIESTRQLALGSQNGMSPHLLQSRKVAGAKFDNADGLNAYSRAINQHIARNAHSAELSDAMLRLDNHENSNRNDADATTRSIVANTMRDRVYEPSTQGVNSKISPLMHKLMTMSFINFLVRPSHIFLSQVHPYIYSVPMMAGRHGYWKALNAQKQAMKDLGGQFGNLGRGAKSAVEMAKSVREKDTDKAVQMAHGADPVHDMIARLTDKNERDAMMKMYETQHLHSSYDSSMFSGGGADRTNAIMQQFTDAMEANNRLSTALAAYRLEREATGDHANALAYGRRVIEETHGLYSAGNTAPIFKNPLMRATLQFHQQPMNLAFMLYRNAFKALKGDTEARWTLAYQLGTAAMLGGMGGMPLDLPKLAGLATQPVTGMAPSDWDDKMRRELAGTLGQTATNAVMDGLPGLMGPLGPSLGHRMGFDAGLLNDEPKSASGGDVLSWAAKNIAGAPGGMMMDWFDALHSLEGGDYQKAAEKFLPGSLKDFAKAYRLGTTGVQAGGKTIRPASYGDALLQTLGFSGVERERQMEGHYKLQEALKDQPKTVQEQLKAKQAAKRAAAYPLGVKPTAKNAAVIRDYRNAYQ